MADNNKDLISNEVLQKATQDILQAVVEHVYDYEEYSDEFISDLFQLTPEEAKSISEIINDEVVSKYKLWSSQGTTNKINEAKLECQNYSNELIKDLSSISLEWCETSLPAIGEVNKIYVLPVISGGKTVNTLNIWNSTTSTYVTIGNLEIDLTTLYTKSEIDTMLADYAKKTEVLSIDNVITDTSKATGTNVLSASTSMSELDKKVDKTNIATSINSTSTDETVPGALTVYNAIYNLIGLNKDTNVLTVKRQPREYEGGEINLEIPTTDCDLSGNVVIDSYKNYLRFFEEGGKYRGCRIDLSNMKDGSSSNICTTNISDVPATDVVFTDSNVSKLEGFEICKYCVKNGVCYVTLNGLTFNSNYVSGTTFANLPKPVFRQDFILTNAYGDIFLGRLFLEGNGTIHLYTRTTPVPNSGYCSFSYPVAES